MSLPNRKPRDPSVNDEESLDNNNNRNNNSAEWVNDIIQMHRDSIYSKHGIDLKENGPDFKAQMDSRTPVESSIETSMNNYSAEERRSFLRSPILSSKNLFVRRHSEYDLPEYVFTEAVDNSSCCSRKKRMILYFFIFNIIILSVVLALITRGNSDHIHTFSETFDGVSNITNDTQIYPTLSPNQLDYTEAGISSTLIPTAFPAKTSSPTSIDTPTNSPTTNVFTQTTKKIQSTQVPTDDTTPPSPPSPSPTKSISTEIPSSKPSCTCEL